jgi:hypothetical protein
MNLSMDVCHDVPTACRCVPLFSHGLMEKELTSYLIWWHQKLLLTQGDVGPPAPTSKFYLSSAAACLGRLLLPTMAWPGSPVALGQPTQSTAAILACHALQADRTCGPRPWAGFSPLHGVTLFYFRFWLNISTISYKFPKFIGIFRNLIKIQNKFCMNPE